MASCSPTLPGAKPGTSGSYTHETVDHSLVGGNKASYEFLKAVTVLFQHHTLAARYTHFLLLHDMITVNTELMETRTAMR